MNSDDLRHLLSATPDEPPVPADPAGLVQRRARAIKARRRGTAGALAVAVAAALIGTAVAIPNSHDAGDSQLHVAAPSSSSPSTSTTPTPTPTAVPHTTSSAPAQTVIGLPFTWSVTVSGDRVTVGGSWTGFAPTLSAADLARDSAPSTFAQEGSGVIGLDASVVNGDGSQLTDAEATAGVPGNALYQSNGDIPACTGPTSSQHRTVSPETFTVSRPGSYRLTMHSYTCAGERDDSIPFTVGGLSFAWDVHVYGDLAQVGGTWSGLSAAMTALDNGNGYVITQLPGASPAVVGHLDLDTGGGTVQGSTEDPGIRTIGYPLLSDTDEVGSRPLCGGPARQRSESIAQPYWVRFPHAGTYTLGMRSLTCTGEVDSTTTVTVGATDPFKVVITPSANTVTTGSVVTYVATATGPATGMQLQFLVISPDGDFSAIEQRPSPAGSPGCAPSAGTERVTQTYSGEVPSPGPNEHETGTWQVIAQLVCDPSVTLTFDSDGSTFPLDAATAHTRVLATSPSPSSSASPPSTADPVTGRRED